MSLKTVFTARGGAGHARQTVACGRRLWGFGGARAAYGRSYDFEAWPTAYLTSRFGDRQAQGR